MVSGLISSSNVGSVGKFPGLGDIPILGAFFRNSQIQRDERELLMIVTPHLVQPLAANAQLPSLPGEGCAPTIQAFRACIFWKTATLTVATGYPNEPEPEPDLPGNHP